MDSDEIATVRAFIAAINSGDAARLAGLMTEDHTFVALGIVTGDIIFVLTALYGLAAVAELMGGIFVIVRYLGACYLIWLGYRTWISSNTVHSPGYQENCSPLSCYISGLCITLGNPMAIVFYLSFFPAFIDLNRMTGADIATTLTIVLTVLTTVLFTLFPVSLIRTRNSQISGAPFIGEDSIN